MKKLYCWALSYTAKNGVKGSKLTFLSPGPSCYSLLKIRQGSITAPPEIPGPKLYHTKLFMRNFTHEFLLASGL